MECNIQKAFHGFGMVSGLSLNKDKSEIMFSSNTPRVDKILTGEEIGVQMASHLLIYLGTTTDPSGIKHKDIAQDLVSQFKAKLQGRKVNLLPQAGRLALCRSVLGSLSVYLMSSMLLSSRYTRQMNMAMVNFWWGLPQKG